MIVAGDSLTVLFSFYYYQSPQRRGIGAVAGLKVPQGRILCQAFENPVDTYVIYAAINRWTSSSTRHAQVDLLSFLVFSRPTGPCHMRLRTSWAVSTEIPAAVAISPKRRFRCAAGQFGRMLPAVRQRPWPTVGTGPRVQLWTFRT